MKYLNELISILNEMSPFLLLGFFISGLLHVYVPRGIYAKFLHRKGFRSVVSAALLGVPLPLCSCGVIPTAISLKRQGASNGATVAFLVGTPQTGVDSILATYSLLGLPFAIIRPVAAFIVSIFSGVVVDRFGNGAKRVDYKSLRIATQQQQENGGSCGCGCGCSHSDDTERSFVSALRYGFVYLMRDYGKWLVFGLLAAAAITAFLPDSLFTLFKEHYMLNLLLILLISAPMYICATGSIPIALSLIMKGISPGAAFVLLMAGPATNLASLIIIRREMGGRRMALYLISIIIGALLCAVVIDYALPQEWFEGVMQSGYHLHEQCHAHDHAHCTHGPIWWQTICSVVFIALFANSMRQKNGK